jgi:hypothetical protein
MDSTLGSYMRTSRKAYGFVLMVLATWAVPCSADTGEDMASIAKALVSTLSAIWDGNESLWRKINVVQVNIALDNLHAAIIDLENKKIDAKKQILNGGSPQLLGYEPEVHQIASHLRQFANAINQATGSAALGDPVRQATESLVYSKEDSLSDAAKALAKGSRSDAVTMLNESLQYDLQIERALGCIQDTVKKQKRPEVGCNFAQ